MAIFFSNVSKIFFSTNNNCCINERAITPIQARKTDSFSDENLLCKIFPMTWLFVRLFFRRQFFRWHDRFADTTVCVTFFWRQARLCDTRLCDTRLCDRFFQWQARCATIFPTTSFSATSLAVRQPFVRQRKNTPWTMVNQTGVTDERVNIDETPVDQTGAMGWKLRACRWTLDLT